MAGFAVRPLVPSDPPQIGADDQLVPVPLHDRLPIELLARLLHPRPPSDRRTCAARGLEYTSCVQNGRSGDGLLKPRLSNPSQPRETNERTNVRCVPTADHIVGILNSRSSREADQMYVALSRSGATISRAT